MNTRRFRCLALTMLVLAGLTSQGRAADTARVFRCTVDGRVTFSDRPCPNADVAEVAVTPANSYTPTEPARARSTQKKRESDPGRNDDSIASEQARAKQQCERLRFQLDSLQEKLRSGYSAKEDRKLHERQRQLQERMRIERCR